MRVRDALGDPGGEYCWVLCKEDCLLLEEDGRGLYLGADCAGLAHFEGPSADVREMCPDGPKWSEP